MTPSGIEAEVCADIAHRQALGIAKYGQTVADSPLPLRAWLQHAYEEVLDQAVYLKRAMAEMDDERKRIADMCATRAADIARAWGDTHDPGITVNARNAASKIARGIEGQLAKMQVTSGMPQTDPPTALATAAPAR